MDMTGTQRIEAPRYVVYAALNDVDVLRQCIPGCESIEKVSDQELKAKVTLKIGPMKVSFTGGVMLSDLEPPSGYTISGEGSGGVAGFAKGSAAVRLESDGEATLLTYTVKAEIGGKIAQLGARLIDGTAKKLAGEFFAKLGSVIAPPGEVTEPAEGGGKRPGWLGRAFASTSAVLIAGSVMVTDCCLTGHASAPNGRASVPICHASLRAA